MSYQVVCILTFILNLEWLGWSCLNGLDDPKINIMLPTEFFTNFRIMLSCTIVLVNVRSQNLSFSSDLMVPLRMMCLKSQQNCGRRGDLVFLWMYRMLLIRRQWKSTSLWSKWGCPCLSICLRIDRVCPISVNFWMVFPGLGLRATCSVGLLQALLWVRETSCWWVFEAEKCDYSR